METRGAHDTQDKAAPILNIMQVSTGSGRTEAWICFVFIVRLPVSALTPRPENLPAKHALLVEFDFPSRLMYFTNYVMCQNALGESKVGSSILNHVLLCFFSSVGRLPLFPQWEGFSYLIFLT